MKINLAVLLEFWPWRERSRNQERQKEERREEREGRGGDLVQKYKKGQECERGRGVAASLCGE
jgi:hypothetical protein